MATVEEIARRIIDENFDAAYSEILHEDFDENSLTHYGILGMKWGVRRTPEQLGHKTSKKKKTLFKQKTQEELAEEARKKAEKAQQKAIKKEEQSIKKAEQKAEKAAKKQIEEINNKRTPTDKKSMKQMTDKELGEAIVRLQAEKQYKELLREVNKTTPTGAAKAVESVKKGTSTVVSNSVKAAATTVLTAYLTKKAIDVINENAKKKGKGDNYLKVGKNK